MAVVKELPSHYRTGIGFDAHLFGPQRKLILGGVEIPYSQGLAGHSDGDVLLHAITDALLGALGLPDIGSQFPDSDSEYLNADSASLLRKIGKRVQTAGYHIANLDCIVVCDEPKLAPHATAIRSRIAGILGIETSRVGIKAKTTEGTFMAIPGKSITAFATVLLHQSQ
ncbi:2-C-methyl-D-erythritol 2,4-cyclodiphosphate synthase [candidate division WOR-3 bacterium JGI_Cruoil_03_51_56]|uniref:2-C-methyl-D-erythritol 2,4-cyclodiphosphate synthase n=1 Tax=candidate division WOR-3 bacterium JGI_Cruoil_03_51_56 TaxID=1973747 RepID=A0A235BU19_UNCW3|nr:MAG: 2-C-methyl-D-erythritol 2,4-cyclodiphosphate synthase [candidate division WOR-3 bacterium JGI_Cruoil_03_51_56]